MIIVNVGNNIGNLNMLIFKQISNRHKELGFDITPVQAMIIIGVYNNRKVVSCAWLYNNINDKQSIKDTKMSIDKLEAILGFDLFPELNKKDKSVEKKTFYF